MPHPTETLDFIAGLSLPDAGAPLLQSPAVPATDSAETDSASIAGHSVVSFVSGLSQQNREDVLNSTLLMQLAASKAFDKAQQREEWFRFYTEGLGKLGWTVSNSSIERYVPRRETFTMDQVALDIIEATMGGGGFEPVMKKTFAALKKQPQALALFERHSDHGWLGMFQILPCSQTAEGNVSMLLNCMQFIHNALRYKILFFTYRQHDVQVYRSAQLAVLDSGVYSQVREAVLDKLGGNAGQFVARLAL
ncbi:hypothetical protein [Pseudomonas sp. Marseille-P9899]|uniref:hypothetical protein n=1 Tax=Pseudomonas sp. Marseille-P9899 TaxID=2730401 RepID=UPI00158C811B|nr:hypothetical protein [Pseudomonas sp. Marseille-P9899]